MAQDPRRTQQELSNKPFDSFSTPKGYVCTMSDFGKAYAQLIILSISGIFGIVMFALVLMFALPNYLNWTANKSIQRSELLGMADLARAAQQSLIVVEQAHSDVVAMGIMSKGQQSAARAKAEAIKIVGEAAKRYDDFAKDEYLLSVANALNKGEIEVVNIEKP